MFMAKTYCPVDGKIGEDAYNLLVNKYDYVRSTVILQPTGYFISAGNVA